MTDSIEVVRAIEENKDCILRSVMVAILVITKIFAFIKFRHFSKVMNVAAHTLAKFCLKSNAGVEFFDFFSDSLLGNPVDVCLFSFALIKKFLSTKKKKNHYMTSKEVLNPNKIHYMTSKSCYLLI